MMLWRYFSRSFLLATNEIWYRSECLGKYEYAERVPIHPYIVAIFQDGMTDYFYAEEGKAWIKREVWRLHDEGIFTIDRLIESFRKSVDAVRIVRERKEPLALEEISGFSEQAEKFWVYLTAVWFAIEDREERGESEYLGALLGARKYGESGVVWINETFQRSVLASYPKYRKYAPVLTLDEIVSGDIPDKSVLDSRLSGYFLFEGGLHVGSLDDAERACGCHLAEEHPSGSESGVVRGRGAQSGLATGRVRIVRHREDLEGFHEGEIIVSPTTTPDFMSALLRCAAIVTDEGGIVSHAAIVARELKKPCIIGTKIATKVLKDGDMVEVNADRGVVRVLEDSSGKRG
jgi:phosphohistidine swiveling domain-containing protein